MESHRRGKGRHSDRSCSHPYGLCAAPGSPGRTGWEIQILSSNTAKSACQRYPVLNKTRIRNWVQARTITLPIRCIQLESLCIYHTFAAASDLDLRDLLP